MRNEFIIFAILTIVIILGVSFFWPPFLWAFVIAGPLILWGIYDMFQSKHTITRNFPILGHGRYWAEDLRPKLYQYFIESEVDGTPLNRMFRTIIYQRAKKELDTTPFGTKLDVYAEGYEWMSHSIGALDHHELDPNPRVMVGGPDCKQPYACSLFNISAMSYGSLSKNAVMALNGGAKIASFAHNTGEGGVSPYHLKYEGDLIYQIGTGYFGCRAKDGNFSPELYQKTVSSPSVKMIELKLSQGAKPGHGGILPASKNTEEIAKIRTVEAGTDVLSPPYHKAFNTPIGLIKFIKQLRDLSGGRPVGFKLCMGRKSEFLAICKAMIETGIKPDFISVDGGEGGTGAAPLEFSNSVGTPLKEGLAFAHNALVGFGLRKDIKILAAGKIFTAFHIFRTLALGADICYSARGMMIALGCIQALECNQNTCPTGITTHDPERMNGLVVSDKKQRVANYHHETIESFVELLAAAGIRDHQKINRSHVNRRIVNNLVQPYTEIYPYIPKNSLLSAPYPAGYERAMEEATSESFLPLVEDGK